MRISDAEALLATGANSSGCYYMAGYAVECALKACIAKQTLAEDWPPAVEKVRKLYTHDFDTLLIAAGLSEPLADECRGNVLLKESWTIVRVWSEAERYAARTQAEAADLVTAIADPQNGVLAWLQRYW